MLVSSAKWVLAALAITVLTTVPGAEGHGFLTKPKTTFSTYGGGYSAIVQNSTLTPPAGKRFVWYQDVIAQIFADALKPTGQSLKNFILKNQDTSVQANGAPKPLSAACGFSNPNGTPQPLPDKLQWQMDFQHPGPCEVYCDDELVVPYTTDCWATFSDNTIAYDRAKCVGKKQLTLYFLAVHYPPWQVYINCVPLSDATTAPATTTARPAAITAKPVATTAKPAATTVTPVTEAPSTDDETGAEAVPIPTTVKPVATTMKPMVATKTPTTPMPTKAPKSTKAKPVTATPAPAPADGKTICKTKAERK